MQQWPTVRVKLADLTPAMYNPRTISDEALRGLTCSMEKFGIVQPIVFNKRSGNIVGGHQRFKVLQTAGITEVDATEVDLSEADEQALNVALNNPTIQGEYDEKTRDLLRIIKANSEVTFNNTRMDALAELLDINLKDPKEKEDAEAKTDLAEEMVKEWDVRVGDLWSMGDHTLFCNDSTLPESFLRLLGTDRAALGVTSPPQIFLAEYQDNGITVWTQTVKPVISNLCRFCDVVVWQASDVFATGGQFMEPLQVHSALYFMEQGYKPIWTRIWEKIPSNKTASPRQLLTDKPRIPVELVTAFTSDDGISDVDLREYDWITAYGSHMHKFVKRLSKKEHREWGYNGIWTLDEVPSKKGQPSVFPIDLPIRCIKMHSDEGDLILDPFSGTGTTILACENTGRKCRAIESDPKMVAVSLQRYFDACKKKPVKLENI